MSIFSRLFNRGENPIEVYTDKHLGEMRYSGEDESWIGRYKEYNYKISYEGKSTPSDDLVAYASTFLNDENWIEATVTNAKENASKEYAEYRNEICMLKLGAISFYKHNNQLRIIADLEGGEGGKCWRIEYGDKECDGIGFDN